MADDLTIIQIAQTLAPGFELAFDQWTGVKIPVRVSQGLIIWLAPTLCDEDAFYVLQRVSGWFSIEGCQANYGVKVAAGDSLGYGSGETLREAICMAIEELGAEDR